MIVRVNENNEIVEDGAIEIEVKSDFFDNLPPHLSPTDFKIIPYENGEMIIGKPGIEEKIRQNT